MNQCRAQSGWMIVNCKYVRQMYNAVNRGLFYLAANKYDM